MAGARLPAPPDDLSAGDGDDCSDEAESRAWVGAAGCARFDAGREAVLLGVVVRESKSPSNATGIAESS
jgi:hypothetical protein